LSICRIGAYNANVNISNSFQPELRNRKGARPPLFGLLSNLTPANEQGATIGVAQSAGALARILGPLFAVILYLRIAPLPYVFCGGLAILAALLTWQFLCRKNSSPAAVAGIRPQ
jgi:hypothetical protein